MVTTDTQVKDQGQRSVGPTDTVETNERTDRQTYRRTEPIALPASLTWSVMTSSLCDVLSCHRYAQPTEKLVHFIQIIMTACENHKWYLSYRPTEYTAIIYRILE